MMTNVPPSNDSRDKNVDNWETSAELVARTVRGFAAISRYARTRTAIGRYWSATGGKIGSFQGSGHFSDAHGYARIRW